MADDSDAALISSGSSSSAHPAHTEQDPPATAPASDSPPAPAPAPSPSPPATEAETETATEAATETEISTTANYKHRQSIGNAASLFGAGGDADEYDPHDDFFASIARTPTQHTLDLPSQPDQPHQQPEPQAQDQIQPDTDPYTYQDPHQPAPAAALFDNADDDWLGIPQANQQQNQHEPQYNQEQYPYSQQDGYHPQAITHLNQPEHQPEPQDPYAYSQQDPYGQQQYPEQYGEQDLYGQQQYEDGQQPYAEQYAYQYTENTYPTDQTQAPQDPYALHQYPEQNGEHHQYDQQYYQNTYPADHTQAQQDGYAQHQYPEQYGEHHQYDQQYYQNTYPIDHTQAQQDDYAQPEYGEQDLHEDLQQQQQPQPQQQQQQQQEQLLQENVPDDAQTPVDTSRQAYFPSPSSYEPSNPSPSSYQPFPSSQYDEAPPPPASSAYDADPSPYDDLPTASSAYEAVPSSYEAVPSSYEAVTPASSAYEAVPSSYEAVTPASTYEAVPSSYEAVTPASSAYEAVPASHDDRTRARIPCITFGVDGKVITYFPPSNPSTPSSYSATTESPPSTSTVQVRALHSLVPASSYATVFDPTSFPGPVFEGATGAGALSRATGGAGAGSAANRAKKAAIVAFLRERADEVGRGLQYLARGAGGGLDADGQRSSDRAVLLRLLGLIVEHDGKTVDNPKFDAAARDLLASIGPTDSVASTPDAYGHPNVNGFPASHSTSTLTSQKTTTTTLATYELTSDFLSELQAKLVQGRRREAVEFALGRRMWAHAMVIASGLDKETWCRVVGEFTAFELERGGADGDGAEGEGEGEGEVGAQGTGGGQAKALQTAYSLFSGQSATHVYDAFRPKVSLSSSSVLPGSVSANGWRDSAAAVVANRSPGDSGVLTAMGDGLMLSEFIEAAHVCYLLSPQTSVVGGVDTPGSRATLIGGHNPRASVLYLRDLDSILLTEIYEFAQSLLPTVKGQEAFNGLPHLQAFRLVHAVTLAELGETARAQKYCEAIAATFKSGKPSAYFHPILLAQLKEFTTRLVGPDGAGSTASGAGSWMTKKMQKPTLDGVWGALEGRFTKFIAGEGGVEDSPHSSQPASKANSVGGGVGGGAGGGVGGGGGIVGPFSHFSSITADAAGVPSQPVSRAGSAMDFRSRHRAESPALRAASALSMRGMPPMQMQPMMTPGIPAQPNTAPSERSSFGGGEMSGGYTPWWGQDSSTSNSTAEETTVAESDAVGDYTTTSAGTQQQQAPGDAPYYGYQPHGATVPQFFSNVEPPPVASEIGDVEGAGFVSPMDAYSRPVSRQPSFYGAGAGAGSTTATADRFDESEELLDEEDDLGLGNRSSSGLRQRTNNRVEQDAGGPGKNGDDGGLKPAAAIETKKPELRPSASASSWVGRFWGRSSGGGETENKAKPKKVHLGEETSFYYDKELKRWVNGTASSSSGASSTPAAAQPPPPPSRPSSAFSNAAVAPPRSGVSAPPMSMGLGGPPMSGTPPPPPPPSFGGGGMRTASSGLSGPPMSGTPPPPPPSSSRMGGMAPPPSSSSSSGLGGPPVSGTPPPPPPSRAGGAKKKPIKARYVVVD